MSTLQKKRIVMASGDCISPSAAADLAPIKVEECRTSLSSVCPCVAFPGELLPPPLDRHCHSSLLNTLTRFSSAALLQCHLRAVKLGHVKCDSVMFSTLKELCSRHRTPTVEHFHHSQKRSPVHLARPHPDPSPRHPLVYFLSLWIAFSVLSFLR